jgi:hypothetical protein
VKLRRVLTPIALVVVAVGVGAYAYVDRGSVTDIERDARLGSVFPAFRRADITRIDLQRGGESFVLARDASPDAGEMDWRIESPVKDVADVGAVQSLLASLELAPRVRAVPGSTAPGLDAPRVRGVLSMGAVTFRFALGDPAPTPEGAAYLRLEGEGTFVVKKELVDALLVSVDRFRPKNIVPYLSIDLAALAIAGTATKGLGIERIDSTDFRLPSLGLRASRTKLDAVWSALGETRAEAFLADGAIAGAATLRVTLTPEDRGKPKGEIVVGGPCPDHPDDVVVVRSLPSPAVAACAPKGILAGLSASDQDLVDARLFSTHEDEVAEMKLQLSPSGAVLELARDPNGWHQRQPVDRELDADEVDAANTLVQQIAHSEGTNVRRRAEKDVLVPRVRAALVRIEQRGVELVEILQPDASGAILAHRLEDDALLTVSKDVARLLEPREASVRGRTVWRPPIDDRPVTDLATTCAAVPQELLRDDSGWSMKAPAGYAPDAASALDLAQALARTRTEMWIADDDDGSFGLSGKGACHVSMSIDDGGVARTVGLTLGAPARQGEALFYAKADSGPEVFVAPRSLRDLASKLLVDRSGFRVDPDLATEVLLARRDGRAVSLVPGKERDFVLADGGTTEAAERAAVVLSVLVADAVVHLGPPGRDEGFDHPLLEVRARTRDDAGAAPSRFTVGLLTERANQKMYFAREDGVSATFAIAKDKVDDLLKVLE